MTQFCGILPRISPQALVTWRLQDQHYGAPMSKLKKGLEALRKTYQAFQAPVESKNSDDSKRSGARHQPIAFTYGDEQKPAQVFGTRTCSFTHRALYLLEDEEIETTFVDLGLAGAGAIRRELTAETGQHTVPYVYLRGRFIGGFRELDQIQRAGDLQATAGTQLASVPHHGEGEEGEEDT